MKQQRVFTIGILALLVTVVSALAQSPEHLPPEADQVLFIIDDSASMTEVAFDPDDPRASRWQIVQQAYPQWLRRLGLDTLVGALSVGGPCGTSPLIRLPVGTDRPNLAAAMAVAKPNGPTNLNAALEAAPGLFASGVRGSKRILLLSDGLNTCPPMESTCAIAKQLHQDHGVVIDVVAWVTEPGMVDEFKCMSEVTGGTFTAPRTLYEWVSIPFPVLDPWPHLVLALGCVTLILAAFVLYRHAFHVLGWSTGQATLAAGLLLSLGTLLLYLVLFKNAGIGAMLLGFVVLAAIFWSAARNKSQTASESGRPSSWTFGMLAAVALLAPVHSTAAELPNPCAKVMSGGPEHHHLLVLDVSESVFKHLETMKALLACYAEMYARPNEEISLIVFGQDEGGSVKELRTFIVPPSGSTATLNRLLDDLGTQPQRKTRTYFKPVADFLNEFLQRVRLDPVIMVVSDGKSDGPRDAQAGLVDFKEIPFESFGKRGVYAVPGTKDWKVAISGGNDLDLTGLFRKALVVRGKGSPVAAPLAPVLDPCLLEPALLVETDERVSLRPKWWNPFSQTVEGSLTIRVRHECVARIRSFQLQLRSGDETVDLSRVTNLLIEQTPRSLTFPVIQPASGTTTTDALIRILLDEQNTTRTVYPYKPSVLVLEKTSYLSAFGSSWALFCGVMMVVGGVSVIVVRRHRRREDNRPEVVKVLGGQGVPLFRGQSLTVGGEGCQLVVPGVASRAVLAVAERGGAQGQLTLQPGQGIHLKVNGVEGVGSMTYSLGQPLQCIDSQGRSYDFTLYPGRQEDIGFGMTIRGGAGPARIGTFPVFGKIAMPETGDGFGPVGRGTNRNSGSTGTDPYI